MMVHVVSRHGRSFTNDVLVADDFEIYGLTADIVLDLLVWIAGSDRRPRWRLREPGG
ncbi:MAG TPA: hypothetical protein VIK61_20610 [Acidimicrobiia bacterium]